MQKQLRPATRQLILSTVKQMGYVPHHGARSLKSGRTNTIVVATCEALHHPYVHELIEELQAALASHGYQLTLELMHRASDQQSVYRSFVNGRCDGVVTLQLPFFARKTLEDIHRRGMPVIAVEPGEPPSFSCVDYDRVEAARIGTEHLLKLGHRRVALVFDAEEGIRRQQRLRGYCTALEQSGLTFDDSLLFPCPIEANAEDLWRRMGSLKHKPTGLICYNDELAVRLLRAIRSEQVRVPEDMAMIVLGNSRMVTFVEVPLTAVDTNNLGIANAVVKVLLEEIENPGAPPHKVLVKPFLVERASSAGINK